MILNFKITFDEVEYEIEGEFTPSDNGDRDTPPSGDEWEITDILVDGVSLNIDFTVEQEDKIYEEAKAIFWEQYGDDGYEPE